MSQDEQYICISEIFPIPIDHVSGLSAMGGQRMSLRAVFGRIGATTIRLYPSLEKGEQNPPFSKGGHGGI
jgi:hypothetical protein